jgi:hypothetical protein
MTPGGLIRLWERQQLREERQDRRIGALMALYAEAHRDRDRRSEPYTVDDFCGTSRYQTVVRAVERMPDETVEDFLARISRPRMDPAAQIESIKAQARGFGKWTVENG